MTSPLHFRRAVAFGHHFMNARWAPLERIEKEWRKISLPLVMQSRT
jgi:hypothetical protein